MRSCSGQARSAAIGNCGISQGTPNDDSNQWALGHKACREGFSVLYKRASRLFTDLAQARGEGRLPRLMNALERTRLLIIDDWGPEPLNAEQRRDLLEIVDDRVKAAEDRPRSPRRGPARDAQCPHERRSGARGEACGSPWAIGARAFMQRGFR
jgi:hypothetical protein